jgi:hypothetical protein
MIHRRIPSENQELFSVISRAHTFMSKLSEAFEQQISRLHELVEGSDALVTWNDRIPDPDNPQQPRQIDVSIKRGDALTIVECRLHKESQDVKWIEELIGRRLSLRAQSAIAVSASGFTGGAIKKAQAHGIFLRDLDQLTATDVERWGCLISMRIYYYQYENLALTLHFGAESIRELDLARAAEELRTYPGRQSLFNASSRELDRLKLITVEKEKRKPIDFRIRLRLEDFRVCDHPVIDVEFSGTVQLIEQDLEVPTVVAYGDPANSHRETSVVIQKTSLGETGAIVQDGYRVATVLDLSALTLPANCQFIYFRTGADKELDMDSFEILGAERLYATGGQMTVTFTHEVKVRS